MAPRIFLAAALVAAGMLLSVPRAGAQDEAPITYENASEDTTGAVSRDAFSNQIAGEFTPARGFDLIKTQRGSLNISGYGVFRYLNQMPGDQTFTDHLGRTRTVKARNDLNWHRTFVWVTGFLYDPRLRYNLTIWGLGTTQQTLVFGNMMFRAGRPLTLGVGIAPNLTNRSMQGSWPFWAGSDRQMTEESLRGGFSSGFFVTGQPVERLYYTASLNTNLSQLGVTATNDTRDLSYSGSVWWMPTTNEFGPRGGFGDLEHHEKLATRFGVSASHAREARGAPIEQASPNETQIRLSDGVYLFETGALADTVTVLKADYDNFSFDAGFKYKGFSFQGEYTWRKLSNFDTSSPVPVSSLEDQGFFAEAMHMVVPKKVGLYAVGGKIWDEFDRNPWELGGGMSYYPFGGRSWRLNLHVMHVEKSPTGSNFGYYTAGQTGTILSLGTDILI